MATLYETLVDRMVKAEDAHPRSYVIMDASTYEILGTGMDLEKLAERVNKKLKKGQVTLVCAKPRRHGRLIV